MWELGIADWAGIICSVLSFMAAIIIATIQYRQSKRISAFERRQDERDERRHVESVKSQAVSFISKYYADRGLIPLCAIAAIHNDLFYYSREMYREFCCMTLEVQNCILEYCELDLRVKNIEGLFDKCIKALERVIQKHFPNDDSPFYDGGKYVLRSLERYGNNKIPVKQIDYCPSYMDGSLGDMLSVGFNGTSSYESCIADILREAFQDNGSQRPIDELKREYRFGELPEIQACQFATTLAQYIAIYSDEDGDSGRNYGSPGGYAEETIVTMEDLFLLSMFEMYIHLILKEA